MPQFDGLEAARRIAAEPATGETRIFVLTTSDLDEYVFGGLSAGPGGFFCGAPKPAELPTAARIVAAGDALPARSLTTRELKVAGPVAEEAG